MSDVGARAERSRRIVIAAGGTGGHLFPALAVAAELRARHPAAEITFVGSRRGPEQRIVPARGYPLWALPLEGWKGRGAIGRARAVAAAAWAFGRCAAWMASRRPDLVIGAGGYASGPPVLAAQKLRVRTLLLEQNHFPGATNRWLAPRADAVCVPSLAAAERIRGRRLVTGNPVRAEFARIGPPPSGRELSLLVFGGSRGARSINRALAAALPRLARLDPPLRIVHQTGAEDERVVAEGYERSYPRGSYEVLAFIDDMPERFAAADLVVCRAGASTVAELAAAGRPSVLVPYPFAADDHQRHNARVLGNAHAAIVVEDRELEGGRLADVIAELAADPEARQRMALAARSLARPDAALRIADVADALMEGRAPTVHHGAREGAADVP
jgi:UDP-N-acetylglucosamine--N-acetylmuramyl-(pentapeptide) pyrophosphoryl-undecaprenol N-acetylglucosamine transferase